MKSLIAFMKKEMIEQIRSGKCLLFGILFLLFGIMNPAIAKLTPWILQLTTESLTDMGITVTEISVSAMDSWVQFFKNMPIALIVFVLAQGGIFTKEYASGTLVLSLTKGLERFKVVLAKTLVLVGIWSVGYWLCFGVTYGYNAYFWDNAVAKNLATSVLCWWLFGLFAVSLTVLFSTLSNTSTGVLLGTGGVVLAFSLLGMIKKISKYVPTFLTDGNSLIYGVLGANAYTVAIIVTAIATVLCFACSIWIFDKKQL